MHAVTRFSAQEINFVSHETEFATKLCQRAHILADVPSHGRGKAASVLPDPTTLACETAGHHLAVSCDCSDSLFIEDRQE